MKDVAINMRKLTQKTPIRLFYVDQLPYSHPDLAIQALGRLVDSRI